MTDSRVRYNFMTVGKDPVVKAQLRIHPDLKTSRNRVGEITTSELDVEKLINFNLKLCELYIIKAIDSNWGIQAFFGGDNLISDTVEIDYSILPKDQTKPKPMSFASTIQTGANYMECYSRPLERYKFYHSFRKNVPKLILKEYLKELHELCKKDKISLQIKTESHIYDVCNLYTWDFSKLKQVLQKLYLKYSKKPYELFEACNRVFQGTIEDIDPTHIAFAQEPVQILKSSLGRALTTQEIKFSDYKLKFGNNSHSGRMELLGAKIQECLDSGAELTREKFILLCKEVGVRPEAPYLIAVE